MSDWSAGYVVDVDYTHGFYHELTPSHLGFCGLVHGIQTPDPAERSLTYCELGCGQGFSTNLLAAANPHIQFYATDFNPSHIAGAKALAQAARSTNAHFFDDSFADFVNRKDLPDFDFITLHGIYSWISAENRQAIVEFIRRRLKPGGLVYISYNAMPGWASIMPLRRLMLEHAAAQGTSASLHARIAASLDFAGRLQNLDTRYFASHPKLPARIEQLKQQNRNYVAHEYFNRDLTPFYFMDVAQELGAAKLSWAGSASVLETIDALNLTEDQRNLLSEIDDKALRQTVRDHIVDQQFRKDIFVKGPVALSPGALQERWMEARFVATRKGQNIVRKIQGLRFTADLQSAIYEPLIGALEQGPCSMRELMALPELAKLHPNRVSQALTFLVAKGDCQPCLPEEGLAERKLRADLFNKAVAEHALYDNRYSYLASPITGGGVLADRMAQLAMIARSRQAEDVPRFIWNVLRQAGQSLAKEGKPLTTEAENLAEIGARLADCENNLALLWKNAGIEGVPASANAAEKRTARS